ARRSAARGRSPRLLVRRHVVDGLADGLDLLRVLVRDLDPELVLELHDQLDEVEGVGVEVLLEGSLLGDVRLVDPELLGEDLLDPLVDFLARCCHVTLLCRGGWKAGRSYNLSPLRQARSEAADDVVVDATGREPDRIGDRRRRRVAVRDHGEAAQAEEIRASVRVRIEPLAQLPRRWADEEAAESSGRG